MQQEKLKAEKEMELFKSTQAKELSLLNGFMQAIGKGVIPPDLIMPAIQQLVPNIAIPLSMENKQLQQTSQAQDQAMQQQQMQGQEMQENPQQEQMEPQQEPQEQEMAEQPM